MAAKAKRVVASQHAMIRPMRRVSRPLASVLGLIVWLVGVLVSLAVGFGMTSGTLNIPYIHPLFTITAGWIVVVLTILGVLLKLIDLASG